MASLERRAGRRWPVAVLPPAVLLSLVTGLLGLLLGLGAHQWLAGSGGGGASGAVVGGSSSQQLVAADLVDPGGQPEQHPLHQALQHRRQQQQAQQQQAQQTQQQAQQGAAAVKESPEPGFQPDGYELPTECERHAPLYSGIFEDLRPWFGRGITRADLDACAKVAPAGYNLTLGSPQTDALRGRFRLLSWQDEILITSGGLEREGDWAQQKLHYHMITEIERAAKRFGLPNIEFSVGFGDSVIMEDPWGSQRHSFPEAMCPLLVFSKFRALWNNVLIPSGEFLNRGPYDDYVARMLKDDPVPWEQKEERAIGRWSLFPTWNRGVNRWGEDIDSREWYVKHSVDSGHKFTHFMSPGMPGGHMPLREQRKYKYTLNTDGFTASVRFAKLLATGQTVIKQDSQLIEFYYRALKPWVHYVPTGFNGPEEIDLIVQFLRKHDSLARWIAGNSQRFAATHLVSEGRQCYIKVLFEEMAKLMKYKVESLEGFPARISYAEDKERFLRCRPCFEGVEEE